MRTQPREIAFLVALLVEITALAQVPAGAPAPPVYELRDFGIQPRPAFKQVLLGTEVVQQELRLTATQKKSLEAAWAQESERMEQASRDKAGRDKFRAARELIERETAVTITELLTPAQRDRLDQIQLQAQGPLAFRVGPLPSEGPELSKRLKLTEDQIVQVKALANEGGEQIRKAASLPIVLDPLAGAPTLESIGKLVNSPEFLEAKHKSRDAARKTWAAVIEQIEKVLTEPQRAAYRDLLGPPFDLSTIRFDQDEATVDAQLVAQVLNVGGGGGQRSDPNFDTKVARPAFRSEHPKVLFDEAHHNFHTADGRYKPFAQIMANDGFQIVPNKEKFTIDRLAGARILVIANALGAEGMGQPGASDPAFTPAEADAVRDWVKTGGSLLLITDHAPFGSAAESLALRFGVEMSKGYTADPENSEGGETSLVFTRANQLLGDHPITRGRDESERINRIQTFTGQSLKGPAGSVAILKLGATAFDEGEDGKPIPAAGRSQGLAFAFGEGRVVVMGEAAELSAQLGGSRPFGMNVPGLDNRQMALNIMHWLAGLLEPRDGPIPSK